MEAGRLAVSITAQTGLAPNQSFDHSRTVTACACVCVCVRGTLITTFGHINNRVVSNVLSLEHLNHPDYQALTRTHMQCCVLLMHSGWPDPDGLVHSNQEKYSSALPLESAC